MKKRTIDFGQLPDGTDIRVGTFGTHGFNMDNRPEPALQRIANLVAKLERLMEAGSGLSVELGEQSKALPASELGDIISAQKKWDSAVIDSEVQGQLSSDSREAFEREWTVPNGVYWSEDMDAYLAEDETVTLNDLNATMFDNLFTGWKSALAWQARQPMESDNKIGHEALKALKRRTAQHQALQARLTQLEELLERLAYSRPLLLYGEKWIEEIESVLATKESDA